MLKALAQFTGTLISANSKYDRYKKGAASFTLQEESGYQLFLTHCKSCHPEPLFTDYSLRNTGLPVDDFLNDYGRMMVTKDPADSLKFKVPSLRNVMVTYPYAHDGRVYDIYTMLEHYNTGVTNGPTTDPLVKNKIPLSNYEKGQLVAFLGALTDTGFLNDSRFAPLP